MKGGAKALARRLQALERRLERVGSEITQSSAAHCAALAREKAPVDTGALRSSIGTRSAGKYAAESFASVPYAAIVEIGGSRTPPKPYLLPSAREAAQTFFESARQGARRAAKEMEE